MVEFFIIAGVALLLDHYLGERIGARLFDWYRDWVDSIEQRYNGGSRKHGIGAMLLAIVPILLGVLLARYVLSAIGWFPRVLFDIYVLYLCLGFSRMEKQAGTVSESLEQGNLIRANEDLRKLAGKGAVDETEASVSRAAVETVLKQGNTYVISPLFWFIFLGPVGALLQRLACILDRMWGHRNERFAEFGWAAARLDDILGWVPARITAISYAIMGSFEDALHCWRKQVDAWKDINSGPLLASGFGAMHMQDCDPELLDEEGAGDARIMVVPHAGHVRRVVALVWRVLIFWTVIIFMMAGAEIMGILGS